MEFRNRQSVGVAALDMLNPKLLLSQFSDNHMYTHTLMLLSHYDPVTILMSDTATDSALYGLIQSEHQLAQLHQIKRKYFNESVGVEYIERLCLKDSISSLNIDSTKYLVSGHVCVSLSLH